jgi:hypothetical protein
MGVTVNDDRRSPARGSFGGRPESESGVRMGEGVEHDGPVAEIHKSSVPYSPAAVHCNRCMRALPNRMNLEVPR